MVWTEIIRRKYRQDELRYSSDMTDAVWAIIEPFLPRHRRLGQPRTTDLLAVVNGILYQAMKGCRWRMLPKDFPVKRSSVAKGFKLLPRRRVVESSIASVMIASVKLLSRRIARNSST